MSQVRVLHRPPFEEPQVQQLAALCFSQVGSTPKRVDFNERRRIAPPFFTLLFLLIALPLTMSAKICDYNEAHMKRLAIKADDKNAACAVENSRRGWENPPKACDFFIVLICKKPCGRFEWTDIKKTAVFRLRFFVN